MRVERWMPTPRRPRWPPGKRCALEQVGLFADGGGVREVGVSTTFGWPQRYVDAMVTVNKPMHLCGDQGRVRGHPARSLSPVRCPGRWAA